MTSASGISLERTTGELIVRSEPSTAPTKWSGALFAGFVLLWMAGWNLHDAQTQFAYEAGLATALVLLSIGVLFLLPRSVVTVFDLRARCATRSVGLFKWRYRTRTIPFDAIGGIGLAPGSREDARNSSPVITLKDGTILPLGVFSFSRGEDNDAACAASIDAICAATGLPTRNDPA